MSERKKYKLNAMNKTREREKERDKMNNNKRKRQHGQLPVMLVSLSR